MTSSHRSSPTAESKATGDHHQAPSTLQQVSARATSSRRTDAPAVVGTSPGPCMSRVHSARSTPTDPHRSSAAAASSQHEQHKASSDESQDELSSNDDDDDDDDNHDPSSLSASFLSQLRSDPRTPTARYSFDDHHDYFHRLEWEALVQQSSEAPTQRVEEMQSSTPPGETPARASASSSSTRERSASPASATTIVGAENAASKPKSTSLDEEPRSVATRKRSNSADGSVSFASFRSGRYVARPRHAHPGPPSAEQILQYMRSPRPGDPRPGSSNGGARPRSSSRSSDHAPLSWAQRGNLAMFADAGIPGTSFPHPAVLGSGAPLAAPGHEQRDADTAENTIQPWDSPRIAIRSAANTAELARTPVPPVSLAATKAGAITGHTIDGSDLAATQLHRHESRASRAGADAPALPPADAHAEQGDGADPEGLEGIDDDEQDGKREKPKRSLKERVRETAKSIRLSSNYFALYKAADRTDVALLVVGIVAAIGSGVPLPLIGILFGQLIDGFNSTSCSSSSVPTDRNAFLSAVDDKVGKIAIIAAVNFFLIWTYTTCWSNLGERLVRKMRQRYLAAVLRQDMAFFDTLKPGEVGTRLSADLLTIQNGTSEKMGILISSLSYFVTSYIVAFIKLPRLAGQLVSLLPAFGIVSIVGSRFVAKAQRNTSTHLSHAASLAAEALNNLPVVQAFGAQKRLSNIYQSHLERARRQGTLKALAAACVLGALFFVGYSANALAFFSGSNLIAGSGSPGTVGSVYTVIFLLLDASFIVGQIAPYLQTFSAASGAGQALRETIDKVSPIDATDPHYGITPRPGDVAEIAVELEHVEFSYPARPDEKALQGLSISVPAGHRVALVGLSGSGKSTVASLLQRFYDPTAGCVRVNGTDVREFNVRWLRSQIGVVGQEPVLFDCSIMQSIAHGLVGSPAHHHLHATVLAFSQVGQEKTGTELDQMLSSPHQLEQLDEIKALCIRAAKLAGAHEFIERLPQGYDSQVGEAGGKLSGGQKQRISIARAIVKQPKLLILDEATAALDSHSERAVAKALDSLSEGVTTVAIAHRLATIRNYDQIVVMGAGKVLERGTHKQLLALRGYYYKLAAAQDTGSHPEGAAADQASVDDELDPETEQADRRERKRMDDVAESDEAEPIEPADESTPTSPVSSLSTLQRRSSETSRNEKAHTRPQGTEGPTEKEATEAQLEQHKGGYPPRVILRRVLWLVRREWAFILAGLLTSTIMGGSYSGEAVLFGHVIEALNPQCHTPDGVRSAGREFALYFFILALIQLGAYTINGLVWGLVAERLLFRLRRVSFNTMLHQRLTWFEAQDQNPASMIAALSNDANNLGGVTGTVIGTIFCIFVNLLAGIIVSHAIAWRIAVVILALVPIILTAGYLRLKVLADFQKRHETAYVRSNALAIEAVQCIRTVASLGREDDVMRKFQRSLQQPYREAMRHFLFGNVFLALALSISYFIYAFAYWWGSQNIAEGRYSQTAFFIVLPALLFSAQASGQLLAFAPDFSKAHVSAANFFRLMDQRPEAVQEQMGKDLEEGVRAGAACADAVEKRTASAIEFKGVEFTYPTRSEAALKDVTLSIAAGSFAAFVGQSGSGKTTAMSLIENFYTPTKGYVSVDGLRTDRTPDDVLRRDIAIVPQEPVIFYGTVRFNVLLGLRPEVTSAPSLRKRGGRSTREDDELLAPYREDVSWQSSVCDDEIVAACKAAGIHETILGLKKGYETLITSSQLSGGQKQRLSIARALIRKPRLLLLDESTSALDSQSEQAFQNTLESIRKEGKCTILAIAHRMRTIRDADRIFLFENGALLAQGSYADLMRNNESFKAMVAYQSLN